MQESGCDGSDSGNIGKCSLRLLTVDEFDKVLDFMDKLELLDDMSLFALISKGEEFLSKPNGIS